MRRWPATSEHHIMIVCNSARNANIGIDNDIVLHKTANKTTTSNPAVLVEFNAILSAVIHRNIVSN
jgi:hypothetical protein